MPVMEIIRHKTFAVVRKTAKSAKISSYESFMVYSMCLCVCVCVCVSYWLFVCVFMCLCVYCIHVACYVYYVSKSVTRYHKSVTRYHLLKPFIDRFASISYVLWWLALKYAGKSLGQWPRYKI